MRLWSLLIISVSALTLSACSTMPWSDEGTTTLPGDKKETVAAAKAVPVKASAQEEKEIINLMGGEATIEAPNPEDNTDTTAASEESKLDDAEDAKEAESVEPAVAEDAPAPAALEEETPPAPADIAIKSSVPDSCPGVEVLPDTKSITYFADKDGRPIGGMTARAQLVDIKGGCDYTKDSVIVDIDLIMQGHISDKGRYEGRKDLEAFMTFPYFVAVMDPDGKLIDKKIMATAMRFKPEIDDLDHAEKLTQTIPLSDVSKGAKYTITVGFQLNRQQLDYNRGVVSSKPVTGVTTPASASKAEKTEEAAPEKSEAVKSEQKTEEKTPEAKAEVKETKPAAEDTKPTSTPAPAKAESSASKMKPIVD
ncbi:MAG TPA: hypothetical protein VIN59_07815 [Alphaproteobacteria bacterium]